MSFNEIRPPGRLSAGSPNGVHSYAECYWVFRLRGYCKLIRLRVGNEGDFSVRCVLVKVRDGFPSHNPSVFGTLSRRIITLI